MGWALGRIRDRRWKGSGRSVREYDLNSGGEEMGAEG